MVLPSNFSEAALACFKITSKKHEAIKATCFNGQYAIATDNYRAIKYYLDSTIEKSFTLHNSVIKKIAEANPSYYYVSKGWVHFINQDSVVISTRVIDYAYFDQMISIFDAKNEIYFSFPEGMHEIVDRIGTMAMSDSGVQDKVVTIAFSKGNVNCNTVSKIAKASEDIESNYDGQDFQFSVGPNEIMTGLKFTSEASIGKMLMFKTDNFEYAVFLMG